MLILTRRIGESIVINNNVKITINGISNNGHVKIGVDAPKEVLVDREEIYRRKVLGMSKEECEDNIGNLNI